MHLAQYQQRRSAWLDLQREVNNCVAFANVLHVNTWVTCTALFCSSQAELLSWKECRSFANELEILRFIDIVELKALFEECCANPASVDLSSNEPSADTYNRESHVAGAYAEISPTSHNVAQHTTASYPSPDDRHHHRYKTPHSSPGYLAPTPKFQTNGKELDFLGFLDLVGMLAILVTGRAGDVEAESESESESTENATSPVEVLQLFFYRSYASAGARNLVVDDLSVRSFYGAVDKAVRATLQRQALEKQRAAVDRQNEDLNMMLDCLQ